MNPRRQDLGTLTNLDELLKPSAPEMDLNQPVEAAPPPPEIEVARSTTDPFQINLATADIAGKLHNTRTSSRVKIFALVFIGGPMMVFGIGIIAMAWSNPELGAIRVVFVSILGLAIAGFWPYIIFANRRKKPQSS